MLGSNRSKLGKGYIGLALSVGFAVLIGVVIGWPAYLDHKAISEDAAQRAAYYSEDAKNQVTSKCAVLPPPAARDCAREINDAARAAQREEYDLAAQQVMSLWTAVMGGMATVGVGLSAIGVYLIWTTFRETQIASNSSALSAQLARESLALEKLSAHSQTRPYLFIDDMDLNELSQAFYQITIRYRNFGNSPARDIKVRSFTYYTYVADKLEPFADNSRPFDAGIAPPGHTRRTFETFWLDERDLFRMENGRLRLMIRIDYTYASDTGETFSEAADYYLNGDSLRTKTFYLATASGRKREKEHREQMRKFRADRKLYESQERAHRRAIREIGS